MRTTIDMPDPLLRKAKQAAAERNTTLRALMIEALQSSLNPPAGTNILRDASFGDLEGGGDGVSPEAINAAIDATREPRFTE
jgi:hypothetical protein